MNQIKIKINNVTETKCNDLIIVRHLNNGYRQHTWYRIVASIKRKMKIRKKNMNIQPHWTNGASFSYYNLF